MAFYYLDTSALVKLYVFEAGTEQLLKLAESRTNRFSIFTLAQVELRAAIRRRQLAAEISAAAAAQLLEMFRRHTEARFLIQPYSDALLDVALALVDAYALRGYDAMQLAGFCTLRSISGPEEPIFVCADKMLLSAARNEGYPVLEPTAG